MNKAYGLVSQYKKTIIIGANQADLFNTERQRLDNDSI
jgi:hypothetical protein